MSKAFHADAVQESFGGGGGEIFSFPIERGQRGIEIVEEVGVGFANARSKILTAFFAIVFVVVGNAAIGAVIGAIDFGDEIGEVEIIE